MLAQENVRDFVVYPNHHQQSETLAFEPQHQQQYNSHFDVDLGIHQPYPDLTFNHANSFESSSPSSSAPSIYYHGPSLPISAPSDMMKMKHCQPSPSSPLSQSAEQPPSTPSNVSSRSTPSAASSAAGFPYSGNPGVPYVDNVHGLGFMNNDSMVPDICFTTGMETDMVFAPNQKLTSFAGECANISSVKSNSTASAVPQPFEIPVSVQYSAAVTHRRGSLQESVTGAGITKSRAIPLFSLERSLTNMHMRYGFTIHFLRKAVAVSCRRLSRLVGFPCYTLCHQLLLFSTLARI
jgi:hypothetical protein